MTDKKLYTQFLEGDDQSFDQLVLRHKNGIIYFLSRYTKSFEVAEDISQDVFVYLLLNKGKYDPQYSFKTYIYMIAKSRAINYVKKESRKVLVENIEEIYKDGYEIEEDIFSKETSENVRRILNTLKREYQVVIHLVDFEYLTYIEAAEVMNKSESQIRALVHNARKKLRKEIEKEGGKFVL